MSDASPDQDMEDSRRQPFPDDNLNGANVTLRSDCGDQVVIGIATSEPASKLISIAAGLVGAPFENVSLTVKGRNIKGLSHVWPLGKEFTADVKVCARRNVTFNHEAMKADFVPFVRSEHYRQVHGLNIVPDPIDASGSSSVEPDHERIKALEQRVAKLERELAAVRAKPPRLDREEETYRDDKRRLAFLRLERAEEKRNERLLAKHDAELERKRAEPPSEEVSQVMRFMSMTRPHGTTPPFQSKSFVVPSAASSRVTTTVEELP